jgi:hypothetical protein
MATAPMEGKLTAESTPKGDCAFFHEEFFNGIGE